MSNQENTESEKSHKSNKKPRTKSRHKIDLDKTAPHLSSPADELKKLVFEKLTGDGVVCPCCDQFCKLYRRKLNSGMARALIAIATVQNRVETQTRELDINFFVETPKLRFSNGEYARLRWWGLLEQRKLRQDEKESGEKKNSGRWRLTDKGRQFVEGKIRIPRDIFIYNNVVTGFSIEDISIHEALGKKFNYDELMKPFFETINTKPPTTSPANENKYPSYG